MAGTLTAVKKPRRPEPARPQAAAAATKPGPAARPPSTSGQPGRPKAAPARRPAAAPPCLPAFPPTPPPALPAPSPRTLTQAEALQELGRRASAGSEQALAGLRQLLDERPEIWQAVGDV